MRAYGRLRWSLHLPSSAAALFFACGGGGDSGLGFQNTPTPMTDAASVDAGTGAPGDSGPPPPADDSGYGSFGTIADVEAGPRVDCLPGTYSGMFTTTVTADAGLFALLDTSFGWNGTLSLTLTGTTKA